MEKLLLPDSPSSTQFEHGLTWAQCGVRVQNATSIAGMLLTTEAAVTELPEKDAPPMPPMDPGMGGMGGMM